MGSWQLSPNLPYMSCLVCKVIKHVVVSHMAKHLAEHNIFLDSQHGFGEKFVYSNATHHFRT